ncbi:hypothetical protein C2S52_017924 [Perilla frutescens var. hirtella]|nr:hypothetical protein C2S52_017924 [Perilla frutescens var. hirtella]KAH6811678.1 hypothetical protein C2S51_025440 [Perilla frutescens var. frutescens]
MAGFVMVKMIEGERRLQKMGEGCHGQLLKLFVGLSSARKWRKSGGGMTEERRRVKLGSVQAETAPERVNGSPAEEEKKGGGSVMTRVDEERVLEGEKIGEAWQG